MLYSIFVHYIHEIGFAFGFTNYGSLRSRIVVLRNLRRRPFFAVAIVRSSATIVRAQSTTYGAWRLKVRDRSSNSEQRRRRRYRPYAQPVR